MPEPVKPVAWIAMLPLLASEVVIEPVNVTVLVLLRLTDPDTDNPEALTVKALALTTFNELTLVACRLLI